MEKGKRIEEKKNKNSLLPIVIGALIVALICASFAYFTASVTNNSTPISVTTTQHTDRVRLAALVTYRSLALFHSLATATTMTVLAPSARVQLFK